MKVGTWASTIRMHTKLRVAFGLSSCLVAACSSASTPTETADSGLAMDSGTGDSASCPAYQVPAGTDLTQPIVSFKTDVMPIFNANCGASSCHGVATATPGFVFLGTEAAAGSDAAQVAAGLVGKFASELTTIPIVMAGDPTKSYLMHKLDGDQCVFDSQCADGSCLAEMPNGLGHPLPTSTRDVVRRWIAQGAKSD